jgi:membrane protein DedA with SNARE-associated domain
MLEWLVQLVSGSPWTYGLLFGVAALDAVFPIVPSEASVIAAGVLASHERLELAGVLGVAAAGAWIGDNTSYLAGRRLGRPIVRRVFSGEKARRRLEWARAQLDERGAYLVVVSRFIPGGRTATTFSAGLVRFPWATRFLPFSAAAAVAWATYAALLGYFGGRVFERSPWYGLLFAFAIAGAITLLVEGYRHLFRG